jgi:hypothetical protein
LNDEVERHSDSMWVDRRRGLHQARSKHDCVASAACGCEMNRIDPEAASNANNYSLPRSSENGRRRHAAMRQLRGG